MVRMVNRWAGKDGFVLVKNELGDPVPVVGGLRVEVDEDRSKGDRYYFAFVEGSNPDHKVLHGRRGNVTKYAGATPTLITDAQIDPATPAMLYVVLQKSTISNGQIKGSLHLEYEPSARRSHPSLMQPGFNTLFGPFEMVTSYSEEMEKEAEANENWYGIGFPDQPRPLNDPFAGYVSDYLGEVTTSENIWFPYYTRKRVRNGSLIHDDRFIHAGSFSLGCITVRAHGSWDYICNYLLSRRKSPTLVGAMRVTYE